MISTFLATLILGFSSPAFANCDLGAVLSSCIVKEKEWRTPFAQTYFNSKEDLGALLEDPELGDWIRVNLVRGKRFFRDSSRPIRKTRSYLMQMMALEQISLERLQKAISLVKKNPNSLEAHKDLAKVMIENAKQFGLKPDRSECILKKPVSCKLIYQLRSATRQQVREGFGWEQSGQRLGVDVIFDTSFALHGDAEYKLGQSTITFPPQGLFLGLQRKRLPDMSRHEFLHAAISERENPKLFPGRILVTNSKKKGLIPSKSRAVPEKLRAFLLQHFRTQDRALLEEALAQSWLNFVNGYDELFVMDEALTHYQSAKTGLIIAKREKPNLFAKILKENPKEDLKLIYTELLYEKVVTNAYYAKMFVDSGLYQISKLRADLKAGVLEEEIFEYSQKSDSKKVIYHEFKNPKSKTSYSIRSEDLSRHNGDFSKLLDEMEQKLTQISKEIDSNLLPKVEEELR